MWASKELDLIQNFKNIIMDWIVIPFVGKKKSMFYSKIKLNKWVTLRSRSDTHMRTPLRAVRCTQEALAACGCHS